MTYNVFGGTLNLAQSINQPYLFDESGVQFGSYFILLNAVVIPVCRYSETALSQKNICIDFCHIFCCVFVCLVLN